MHIVALAGGIGAARFLRGLVRAVDPAALTVVANTGDDIRLHGLHVSPDLDTITYTLGGGVHPDQGWGRADETVAVATELRDRYGRPDWFTLGDRDLATHLVRTEVMAGGGTLSDATARIAAAWQLPFRLLPMTDDPVATMISTTDDRTMHFQRWWVGERAASPVARVWLDGAEAARPAPGVLEAIADADLVVLCPSNPVVSIGTILQVPGIKRALAAAPVVGVSPIVGGAVVRGMADKLLPAVGVEVSAAGVARGYGRVLDGWVIDLQDADLAEGLREMGLAVEVTDTIMDDLEVATALAHTALGVLPVTDPPRTLQVIGVTGLGEVAAGDDLAGLIAAAADLRDGDVVVVASKVVAKAEGRTVPTDGDPDGRRRALALAEEVLVETPHVVIVRTAAGLVCANAGIDASNVPGDDLLLLPADPDASAAALRAGLAPRADVAVVVSDTFGRAWREGQTDVALGVAGMPALRDERGRTDREGRPLTVTLVALADQVAGAADLVRDKAAGVPVVVVRGLGHLVGTGGGGGAALVRAPAADLFPHGRGWLARRLATGAGAAVRPGPPARWEWDLVCRAAGAAVEVADDGVTARTAEGLAAGRIEACLLDLGYPVALDHGPDGWTARVG